MAYSRWQKSQKQEANRQKQLEGELAQLARAPALHAGGQGFDSLILHICIKYVSILYKVRG